MRVLVFYVTLLSKQNNRFSTRFYRNQEVYTYLTIWPYLELKIKTLTFPMMFMVNMSKFDS